MVLKLVCKELPLVFIFRQFTYLNHIILFTKTEFTKCTCLLRNVITT